MEIRSSPFRPEYTTYMLNVRFKNRDQEAAFFDAVRGVDKPIDVERLDPDNTWVEYENFQFLGEWYCSLEGGPCWGLIIETYLPICELFFKKVGQVCDSLELWCVQESDWQSLTAEETPEGLINRLAKVKGDFEDAQKIIGSAPHKDLEIVLECLRTEKKRRIKKK